MMMSRRTKNEKRCLFRASHRGSREGDMVLGSFAQEKIHDLCDEELDFFAHLLSFDDREIFAWLEKPLGDTAHEASLWAKLSAHSQRIHQRQKEGDL